MSVARIYQKGQITIPKAVRDSTGIGIGDRVVVEARDDEIVVRRPRGVLEFEPPDGMSDVVPTARVRREARNDRVARRSSRKQR